jgi:hypothetical protein
MTQRRSIATLSCYLLFDFQLVSLWSPRSDNSLHIGKAIDSLPRIVAICSEGLPRKEPATSLILPKLQLSKRELLFNYLKKATTG